MAIQNLQSFAISIANFYALPNLRDSDTKRNGLIVPNASRPCDHCRVHTTNRHLKSMKQPKTSRTNYRIGEFAEYMGVTPDFLKHYEECGLLDVHHSENGYRYFNFDQSSRILEYMRLRNYGVTVKEMQVHGIPESQKERFLSCRYRPSTAWKPCRLILCADRTWVFRPRCLRRSCAGLRSS